MALRSQGPPGLASNRDRREAPPWRVLPLVVVVYKIAQWNDIIPKVCPYTEYIRYEACPLLVFGEKRWGIFHPLPMRPYKCQLIA